MGLAGSGSPHIRHGTWVSDQNLPRWSRVDDVLVEHGLDVDHPDAWLRHSSILSITSYSVFSSPSAPRRHVGNYAELWESAGPR